MEGSGPFDDLAGAWEVGVYNIFENALPVMDCDIYVGILDIF